MSELLDQLNDDELDITATVTITDTDGVTAAYEFLDIVNLDNIEYAVLCGEENDGYVDIFRIIAVNGKESYVRVTDDDTLEKVFHVFMIKNEDEFDFED